jgi:hypothetical protein
MKTYIFQDLSIKAKNRAIGDYIKGWKETHLDEQLDHFTVFNLLWDSEARYLRNGTFIEE